MDGGGRFAFDRFVVDAGERRLIRDGVPVEINSRYFDALLMLVRRPGQLIGRDEFLDHAWNGVPVTDEALSQCVTHLRKVLGDSPSRPRFIETVPKHGYRFVAEVQAPDQLPEAKRGGAIVDWLGPMTLGLTAAIGGGSAGVLGGLTYGLSMPGLEGTGAASILLVMLAFGTMAGLLGGLGIGLGIGVARALGGRNAIADMAGAAAGGAIVGFAVNLIGLDALTVLLGRAPGDAGGALEGLLLGAAVGGGGYLARRGKGWPSVAGAAAAGGLAGLVLPLLGGRLMGGSLAAFAAAFPDSRVGVDGLGRLLGESGFGPLSQSLSGALEGALFCAGVALAIRFGMARMAERAPA